MEVRVDTVFNINITWNRVVSLLRWNKTIISSGYVIKLSPDCRWCLPLRQSLKCSYLKAILTSPEQPNSFWCCSLWGWHIFQPSCSVYIESTAEHMFIDLSWRCQKSVWKITNCRRNSRLRESRFTQIVHFQMMRKNNSWNALDMAHWSDSTL